MPPARPLRVLPAEIPALDGRAASDLRFIRETMENSGAFTAVPGLGGIAMGAVACATAAIASAQAGPDAWLAAWLAGASAAAVAGAVAIARKAGRLRTPVTRGVGAKFVRCLCPSYATGALLTFALWRAGLVGALPGTWLLLYGAALMSAGAFSARVVAVMGASFMTLGAAALLSPAVLGDLWMTLGFGGLHMAFGFVVWRRNGG